ncbi:unnamed protein product [Rhizophagus irregularis]|nr:unnamed protein product [Rhizophagus irregularis]CAB5350573.1 unnamed protein product [Rhizophagus irregularis]
MNENKLLPNLSQNLLEILNDDDEYYDITIEVGTDPYKDDETLSHIKLPNISPEIFEIILRYIYGGKISLNDYDNSDIIKNTLKQCIPFIRLYDLTSKEFVDKVFPYREILPEGLCAYLLETFLTLSNPESRGVERNDRGRNDKVEDKDDTKWRNFRDRRSEERYDNHHNSMRKYDIRPSSESKAENSNNIRTLTTNTYTSLPMRKKLELKPRSSAAVPNENFASRPSKPNPFGEAKPIDTDEAFRRVEERRRKQKKRNVDDYWF